MFALPVKAPKAKATAPAVGTCAPKLPQHMPRRPGVGVSNQAMLRLLSQQAESLAGSKSEGQRDKKPGTERIAGLGAARGPTWDFSKIPLFPPDQVTRSQARPWTDTPPGIVQPKLVVGAANDPLEHEADRVADRVMRMPDPELSNGVVPPQVSRKCAACEEEEAKMLRPKPIGAAKATAGEAPSIVRDVLRAPGQPLHASTRAFFEPRFGYDFSRVQVHSGDLAQAAAAGVNARAYTVKSHLVFAAGQYAPHTQEGKRLLAHELAHVVQQGAAGSDRIRRQGDTIEDEKEADDAAELGMAEVSGGGHEAVEMQGGGKGKRGAKTPKPPSDPCTRTILAEGSCADLVAGSKYICCDPDNGLTREGKTKDIDGAPCPSKKFTPIFTCDNKCDAALTKGCDDNDNWIAIPGSKFTRAQCGDVFTICANGKQTTGYVRDKSETRNSFEVSPGIQNALGVTVGSSFKGGIYRPGANQKVVDKDPCCKK
jgi:Domain of unknown function (DUF4157)